MTPQLLILQSKKKKKRTALIHSFSSFSDIAVHSLGPFFLISNHKRQSGYFRKPLSAYTELNNNLNTEKPQKSYIKDNVNIIYYDSECILSGPFPVNFIYTVMRIINLITGFYGRYLFTTLTFFKDLKELELSWM